MNRQRTLLIILGGVVALIIGQTVVGLYRSALKSSNDQIASLETKLSEAKFRQAEAEQNVKEWRKIGAQTLSMDPNETMQRLRDDLSDLAQKSGLSKEKIDLGTIQPWGRNGLRALSCSLTAEGSMQQVVQFLYGLYRRPYAIRFTSLSLTQASVGREGPKGVLKMTSKLQTLILPPNGKVPQITPADLKEDEGKFERTQFAKLDDYLVLVERRIWEKYVPPRPGKAAGPTPGHDAVDVEPNVTLSWTAGANTQRHQIFIGEGTPNQPAGTQEGTQLTRILKPGTRYAWRVDEVGEGGTTTGDVWMFTTRGEAPRPQTQPTQVVAVPPKPPDPPPADAAMVLTRVWGSPLRQQAVLIDQAQQANPAAPDKRVNVGESFFGGTLVFVHPRGVVSERDGNLRFHAIGLQLQQSQPLTEQEHPEIWQELKKLEGQAAGISDRPG